MAFFRSIPKRVAQHASFTLELEQDEQTGKVRNRHDICLPMPGDMPEFIVPAGTVSDGRSAPPWTWWLVGAPIRNNFVRCWFGHDILCEKARTLWDRADADAPLGFWLWQHGAGFWYASYHF